ncbi:hypothetical protein MAR_012620 [Mya arenaria]|uniref:EGF-like domain-containing protein n=1 Tax=Mya arenaria TaxID=6604 RepID=A0ABY7G1N7_MYAAR|nr:hypothetical protein MAR_012620 [Mya arenaria]
MGNQKLYFTALTMNATCPAPACDDAKKEVCENGYCKISIEGVCTVDQTPTTHTTPAGPESETTVKQGMNGHETTTTDTPTTASTEPTTTTAARRKRRDATQAPITNTHECVNHSLCTKAASSNDLTCQCKDGYAKDDNGFCQEAF